MKQKLFWAVIGSVIAIVLSEVKSPVIELWIDIFGSEEEKILKDYQEIQSEISKRDSVQIAKLWKAEQDSLELVKRLEAFLCIKQEIDRSKGNPCKNSLYYYNNHLFIRGPLRNYYPPWLIGSTKCSDEYKISSKYHKDFPSILFNKKWVKRHFRFQQKIMDINLSYLLGNCTK